MRKWLAIGIAGIVAQAAPPPGLAAGPVTHAETTWRGHRFHVVTLAAGSTVKAVARRPGRTVAGWMHSQGALAAINGGYFNHSDGWPVSHVMADGRALTDPRANEALISNPTLRPILSKIVDDRVEWRASAGGWSIAPHRAPWTTDARDAALQAGPALLPAMDLLGEGFQSLGPGGQVLRDGIASTVPAARSALGLLPDGRMIWVVGGLEPKRGITIPRLREALRSMGATSAMALDGGSSSTLGWREGGRVQTAGSNALVNSALVVVPAKAGGGGGTGKPLLQRFRGSPIAQRLRELGHEVVMAIPGEGDEVIVSYYVAKAGALRDWDDETRPVVYRPTNSPDGFERVQYLTRDGEAIRGHMASLKVLDLDGDGRPEIIAVGAPFGPTGRQSTMIWRRSAPGKKYEMLWRRRDPNAVFTFKAPGRFDFAYKALPPRGTGPRRATFTWQDGQIVAPEGERAIILR